MNETLTMLGHQGMSILNFSIVEEVIHEIHLRVSMVILSLEINL